MARRSNLHPGLPSDRRLQITGHRSQFSVHSSQCTVHRPGGHCSRDEVKLLPSKVRTMVPARARPRCWRLRAGYVFCLLACSLARLLEQSVCSCRQHLHVGLVGLGPACSVAPTRTAHANRQIRSFIRPFGHLTIRPFDHSVRYSWVVHFPMPIVPPSSSQPTLWPRRSRQ